MVPESILTSRDLFVYMEIYNKKAYAGYVLFYLIPTKMHNQGISS